MAVTGDSPFVDGQTVVYHRMDAAGLFDGGSEDPLGLIPGYTYTVHVIDDDSFSLTDAGGTPVVLHVDPTAAGQDFQCTLSSVNRIELGAQHSYAVGEAVRFVSGSGTNVDGLTASGMYYVVAVDDTGVLLSDSPGGDPVEVDVVSELAVLGQQDTRLDTDYALVPLTRIDLGAAHGLQTGDEVRYRSGGDALGLQDGRTYTVEVLDETTVRFLDDTAGPVIMDWSGYTGSEQHFLYSVDMAIDPAEAIDSLHQTISLDTPMG